MKRLRELLALEDLLWAAWLAIFRPTEAGLFLAGGRESVFLVGAAICFWTAALLGTRDAPRDASMLAVSLAVCTILLDVSLQQLDAPSELRLGHAAAVLALGALAAWQHSATGGGAWLHAPAWLRRGLSWPFLMLISDIFYGLLEEIAAPRTWGDQPLGETLFSAGLTLLVVLPLLFAFFVVAPRQAICPDNAATDDVWAQRYLWALAMALLGALVVGPLLGG